MSVVGKLVADASSYHTTNPEGQRAFAVAAAAELIAARVGVEGHVNQLINEMERLSKYADLIQEALKVK
jgi:hypothetical protein